MTGPVVTTSSGAVRGAWRAGSAAFLGVPFAAPPVGELRFAAPAPHPRWGGTRSATAHGATPQRQSTARLPLVPKLSVAGPSTLNVNLFTPCPGRGAGLPVLVFIHGGGYTAGSPASPWYDGAAFNRDGIVTVNVSYRLGFDGFGWMAGAPANRAVLDWIAALEWVRENIAAFGGDPGNVTIAGQSAGGGAVLTLLAVPRAAGLFRRAIAMSATTATVPLHAAEASGRDLAGLAGMAATREAWCTLDELDVLRVQDRAATSAVAPEDASSPASPSSGAHAAPGSGRPTTRPRWAPVVDGELLPAPIEAALANGASANVPLVIGTTDHEFNRNFRQQRASTELGDPLDALRGSGLPDSVAREYAAAHPGLDAPSLVAQLATDRIFRKPAKAIAEARAGIAAPTWLYRFAW